MRVRAGEVGRSRTAQVAAAALLLGAATIAGPAAAQAHGARAETKQPVATGYGGAVASADLDASKAGIAVLRKGGNAIDAAVATASTLGVTEPFVAGPGGGGYMVIYLARQHRVITLDGRETCPATCTSRQFIDPSTGKPLPFEQARRSGLSVGVPGMVATWAKAIRQYGRRSFGADLRPAVGRRPPRVHHRRQLQPAGAGGPARSADLPQQPLAVPDRRTASRCRSAARCAIPTSPAPTSSWPKYGPGYLYRGALGRDITAIVQHPPVVPGVGRLPDPARLMTTRDLAGYSVPTARRRPTSTTAASTSTACRRRRPAG